MEFARKLFFGKHAKISYSQCGEDLVAECALSAMGVARPTYLDLGAHDPVYLSNTYRFYRQGGSGVCVEPNPALHEKIRRKRPRDVCLNVGVGTAGRTSAPFYVMSNPTLGTFSKEEADRFESFGKERVERVVDLPLVALNDLVREHFPRRAPDFVSMDIEGIELEVLSSLDYSACRPRIICVETLTYSEDNTGTKRTDILGAMAGRGYFVYADTYLNTLFVDEAAWAAKGRP